MDRSRGLTLDEVRTARSVYGFNEVPEETRSCFVSFLLRLCGPVPLLLETCAVITGVLRSFDNMALIVTLLLINAIVGTFEEGNADAAVKALKVRLAAVVRVLREGEWIGVSSREIVPGDVVRLRAGDAITSDAVVLSGSVEVDLSMLTGESAPHVLGAGDTTPAGALCHHGEALCCVTRTGASTSFGKTVALVSSSHPPSRASIVLAHATIVLFSVAAICAVAILAAAAIRGIDVLTVVPLVILVLVSCIPSALPAFFTVVTAHGAHELTASGVLVAQLAALDNAASMTFSEGALCVAVLLSLSLSLSLSFTLSLFHPLSFIYFFFSFISVR
jgi:H+-transporting ATPase